MRDDPILSDRLIQLHTDEPYRSLRNRMHKLADEQTDAMHALIAKAYAEGVRDGFVQGVAAAARDTNEPKDAGESVMPYVRVTGLAPPNHLDPPVPNEPKEKS